jgi:hypothetical protein
MSFSSVINGIIYKVINQAQNLQGQFFLFYGILFVMGQSGRGELLRLRYNSIIKT